MKSRDHLPPLTALRAFEATARHLSFSRAAEELFVTPAAISHQIKAIEAFVGVALFARAGRAVSLTEAGRAFLPNLSEGFAKFADAMAALRRHHAQQHLSVSSAPSFAARWLLPRLEAFARLHPGIDVRLSASMDLVDLVRDGFDVAIRFGWGRYPGLRVDKLFDEVVVPMCSPALLRGDRPLRVVSDLQHHTLLHDDSMKTLDAAAPDWRMWLKAAGTSDVEPNRGLRFDQSEHAIQAALNGAGVALGRLSLVRDDLEAERLVLPFNVSLTVVPAYYVVATEKSADTPRIAAFRAWLLDEAKRERDRPSS